MIIVSEIEGLNGAGLIGMDYAYLNMAYQFECAAPDCVFLIRAADESEVISQVKRHSEEQHGKSSPPEDVIRERMETVEVE